MVFGHEFVAAISHPNDGSKLMVVNIIQNKSSERSTMALQSGMEEHGGQIGTETSRPSPNMRNGSVADEETSLNL